MCIIDIIGIIGINRLLHREFKHSKLWDDSTFNLYLFLLSLTTRHSQRAIRALLKKSRNFKKFKILEFKIRNTRNDQDKKNKISYLEDQDKKSCLDETLSPMRTESNRIRY